MPGGEPDGGLRRELAAALAPAARPRFAQVDPAVLENQLVAGHAAGAEAWPAVRVAPAWFARELGRRLGDEAAPAALTHLRFADLYLAIACSAGDGAAVAACEAMAARVVEACGTRLRATPDQVTEIRGRVHEILFVDEPGRPAATREFAGRGDLRGYVRVIATRALIRLINRERKIVAVDDLTMFDAVVPLDDPELAILRERYRGDVDQAMRAAVAQLDERSRALLRYALISGWTVDRIGQLYGVHRATAARWVAEARDQLGDKIRVELAARLGMAPDDVDSIIRLVQSRVDMSLERLLSE
jgi:RNA polymerase sigma-70 factor, ECF subfamily